MPSINQIRYSILPNITAFGIRNNQRLERLLSSRRAMKESSNGDDIDDLCSIQSKWIIRYIVVK